MRAVVLVLLFVLVVCVISMVLMGLVTCGDLICFQESP